MNKRVIPTYYAKSLFDIDISFFKELGIKYVFTDLDNTLDSFKQKEPSNRVIELKENLLKENIELIIISNNKGLRVEYYSKLLGVKYLPRAGKPFSKKINMYIEDNKMEKEQIIMVGDQLMTDIKAGNGCHIKTILTDPIVNEDQWQTRFNRMFDRPARRKLKRRKLLNSWR